jgi:hypothetical protein
MRQKKVKQLRKYILSNTQEVLLIIRNECRRKTEQMGPRQVYQNAKKLYKTGKLTI